jgi:hypothetical protein
MHRWTAALSLAALGLTATLGLATGLRAEPAAPAPAPQIPRDAWKDCSFNGRTIGCRDARTSDGFRLLWRDGPRMTYTLVPRPAGGTVSVYRDRLGGLWRQELLPQGNQVLSHTTNGNRIVIPLRFPCKPPLQGEVGYCRE